MFNVIYTVSCDSADEMITRMWQFKEKNDAINCFNKILQDHIDEIKNNSLLNVKLSIHHYRALVKIAGTHYCIAIVDDMNNAIKI